MQNKKYQLIPKTAWDIAIQSWTSQFPKSFGAIGLTEDRGIKEKAQSLVVQVAITGTNFGTSSILGGHVFILAAKLTLWSQL